MYCTCLVFALPQLVFMGWCKLIAINFGRDGMYSSVGYRKMKKAGFDDNLHLHGTVKKEAVISFVETFVLM